MNRYRVDVQTATGPCQHIVRAKTKEDARSRILHRAYAGKSVSIENITHTGVGGFENLAEGIRDFLSANPSSTTREAADALDMDSEKVSRSLRAMFDRNIVTRVTKSNTFHWSLAWSDVGRTSRG